MQTSIKQIKAKIAEKLEWFANLLMAIPLICMQITLLVITAVFGLPILALAVLFSTGLLAVLFITMWWATLSYLIYAFTL